MANSKSTEFLQTMRLKRDNSSNALKTNDRENGSHNHQKSNKKRKSKKGKEKLQKAKISHNNEGKIKYLKFIQTLRNSMSNIYNNKQQEQVR